MNKGHRWWLIAVFLLIFHSTAYCNSLSMKCIRQIESSNQAWAFNRKSGARGLYQITEICLRDYNQYHSVKYQPKDLFVATVNEQIAKWYLEVRIPQLLRHYGLPVTVRNILWAYNAGIQKVREGVMPDETKEYIKKYEKCPK